MEEELSRQFSSLGTGDSEAVNTTTDTHDEEANENNNDFNDDSAGNCNLIVNYLPHDIDDSALREMFVQYGEILMTKVVRDKNTKKSLGYGFVKFLKEDDAVYAIDKMNGYSIGHKNLKVSIARPPSLEIRNCKLYVTNLPKEYTEREVVSLFKEFGDIIECRVLKDRNSRSNKGVAFVQFNLKAQANNALSLNGCQLEGSSRGLVVKYAEDQHKKKEMSRLHTLTTNGPGGGSGPYSNGNGGHMNGNIGNGYNEGGNNTYTRTMGMVGGGMGNMQQYQQPHQQQPLQSPLGGGAGGYQGINFGSAGMMDGDLMGMQQTANGRTMHINQMDGLTGTNQIHLSMDPGKQQTDINGGMGQPQMYYYQQQGLSSMYGGPGSPLHLMSPLNSPQLSVYLPSVSAPTMLDYSPSNNKRFGKGRKAFQLDIPAEQNNWYSSMPTHMSYMHSPGISLPQQHSPLSMSSVQMQQQNRLAMGLMSPTDNQSLLLRQTGSLGSPLELQDSPLQQQQQYSGSVTLNIANLPTHADVALLHDLFSPYGRILSAQIDVDAVAQNASRISICSGRGRVQMAGLAQAEYAAQALNGAVITEGGLPISVQLSYR